MRSLKEFALLIQLFQDFTPQALPRTVSNGSVMVFLRVFLAANDGLYLDLFLHLTVLDSHMSNSTICVSVTQATMQIYIRWW